MSYTQLGKVNCMQRFILLLIQTYIQTAESCMVAGLTHFAQGNVDMWIKGCWSYQPRAAP